MAALQILVPQGVLILVVVEDGLRAVTADDKELFNDVVLILVVVEDGLRGCVDLNQKKRRNVLILVVMEDGLRAIIKSGEEYVEAES